ncbi:5-(carboxyamino)imidazole ribonucleotide synthase [Hydrotalea sp.]|uniref:5-(carboxyamino)imidazole ribonucleotide synthase n=1 Tax=Hydrotalea sp. TaxID=2881279 RepID=UPI003D0A90D1
MKVGILGGGQLGRMLLQAAANYTVETYVLENDKNCPSAHLCHHFVQGSITDYETVYRFGKMVDALTIEIEAVNIAALEQLEAEGLAIYPSPSAIKTIKNKIHQKQFYHEHQIPTAPFVITETLNEVMQHTHLFPAVHKIGEGGYDGRGVQIIKNKEEVALGFEHPSVLEKMINIHKEIAIIVARNKKGETAIYPPAEMVFDPVLNILEYQIAPARISRELLWKAEAIAIKVVQKLNTAGLFAIEFLIDKDQEIWVNETAPRVHNSGHHTIEASYCSQYDMLWRIILGYPLGNTKLINPSAMINLLGEPGYTGAPIYEGLNDVLKVEQAFVHLYGKQTTKPGRKMGHVTLIAKDDGELIYQAHKIKQLIKVIA